MIYVPAVPSMLRPEVLPAILSEGWEAMVVPVDRSPTDYSKAFVTWWWSWVYSGFTIIEHDVEVVPGILTALANCPDGWCCHPYNDASLLGCTRWRPSLLERAEPAIAALLGRVAWNRLDVAVFDALTDAGYRPHIHEGRAIHHHVYD